MWVWHRITSERKPPKKKKKKKKRGKENRNILLSGVEEILI